MIRPPRPKAADIYVAPTTDRREVLGVLIRSEEMASGGRRCRMDAVNSRATTYNSRMSETIV